MIHVIDPFQEPHSHPGSEEINFIVRGTGEVVAQDGTRTPFAAHTFMFIPF